MSMDVMKIASKGIRLGKECNNRAGIKKYFGDESKF